MTIASDAPAERPAAAATATAYAAAPNATSKPSDPSDPLLSRIINLAPEDPEWRCLARDTWAYVEGFMSRYDASHDFSHIRRVITLALDILAATTAATPPPFHRPLCPHTVALGALLHDIGDRKYLLPSQDASTMVQQALLSLGCGAALARRVQAVCTAVSYSGEVRDPAAVRRLIDGDAPELAVVQDADRLDAIGAVGIGRTFTYGGARGGGGGSDCGGLEEVLAHFGEKLERLEGMMKTDAGREMARIRTERLRVFRGWWEEETGALG